MKNNKGFTLVELIITIVIMIALLAIAIISFVNISNRKKEEAYSDVKKQIEQAAEDFFEVNKYFLNGLEDNNKDSNTKVSLGKLVKEDYLNSVTNPIDNKKLSYCSYVLVTKINGSYKYEFVKTDDNTDTCDTSDYITVVEPGAPSINLSTNGDTKNDSGWYTSDVTITANVNTNKNGTISEVKYCNTKENYCEPNNLLDLTDNNIYSEVNDDEGKDLTTVYKATNLYGKSAVSYINYNIEKKVELKFDAAATNFSTSINSKATGQPVFNLEKGACGFGQCESIKCLINDNKEECPKDYYAKACMYVNQYYRMFKVTGASVGTEVSVKADGPKDTHTEGMYRIESKSRHGCTLTQDYNVFTCGNESDGMLNASAHIYKYTSPAGNESNEIQLFVDYGVDCGYHNYTTTTKENINQ